MAEQVLDLPPSGDRILSPSAEGLEQAVGGSQHDCCGSTYRRLRVRPQGPDAHGLASYPQAALDPRSSAPLPKDMKLLENSSFEAINSQLTVETGDAHIIGRWGRGSRG